MANVREAVRLGIRTVDAAVGDLGGCPFAPGATGNVASEDIVYLLHGEGVEIGIDLNVLLDAAAYCRDEIGIARSAVFFEPSAVSKDGLHVESLPTAPLP
ncbi:MAG: hypothetical protein QNJ43_24890 [Breoghania sp.]|nr:hypothetical protein [Breoghania sp.]